MTTLPAAGVSSLKFEPAAFFFGLPNVDLAYRLVYVAFALEMSSFASLFDFVAFINCSLVRVLPSAVSCRLSDLIGTSVPPPSTPMIYIMLLSVLLGELITIFAAEFCSFSICLSS